MTILLQMSLSKDGLISLLRIGDECSGNYRYLLYRPLLQISLTFTCLIFTGDDIWRLIAEVLSCDRLAQKGSIASNGYRTPSVRLLLGQDGWVEHVDNGIRSVCKGRCFIKVCSDIKIDFSCLKDFLLINVKNLDNVTDLKRDTCMTYIV